MNGYVSDPDATEIEGDPAGGRAVFRADRTRLGGDTLTLQGDMYRQRADRPLTVATQTAPYQSTIDPFQENTMAELSCECPRDDVLVVEEALQAFARKYPRKTDVVTLSLFDGRTIPRRCVPAGSSRRRLRSPTAPFCR